MDICIYICFCVVRIASAQHTENTFIHPSSYTHLTPHICITCPESTELEKYAARSCPEPTTLSITDCPAYSFCSAVLYYQNKSYSRMLRLYFVAQHTTHVPSANIHPSYDFIEMQRTKIQKKKYSQAFAHALCLLSKFCAGCHSLSYHNFSTVLQLMFSYRMPELIHHCLHIAKLSKSNSITENVDK